MIEFVGFDVEGDPTETDRVDGFAATAASGTQLGDLDDFAAADTPPPTTYSIPIVPELEPIDLSPSVAVGGVAMIAPGELSVRVAVGPGYPAIAARLTGPDLGAEVAVVSLDGDGMATIDLNRAPWSEVELTWFVVAPN